MATYRAYADASPPTTGANDGGAVNLGLELYAQSAAWITHLHWWQATDQNSGDDRTIGLFRVEAGNSGTLLASGTSPAIGTGWQTYQLPTPVPLEIGRYYRVVTLHPGGRYVSTSSYFSSGAGATNLTVGPVVVPNASNATGTNQGSFIYWSIFGFPTDSFNAANYWNDFTVTDVDPTSTTVTKTVSSTWNARSRVLKLGVSSWAVVGRQVKTTATAWAVRAAGTKTTASAWAVRQSVPKTAGSTWWVRRQVVAAASSAWNTRSRLAMQIPAAWRLRATTVKTAATQWGVRVRQTQTVPSSWRVNSDLPTDQVLDVSVSRGSRGSLRVRRRAGSSLRIRRG